MSRKTQAEKMDGLLRGLSATAPDAKPEPTETSAPALQGERPRVGRPRGKRTDPDYQSVTTFLHKQTYLDVQRTLVGRDQDFGDVVDSLLKEWLDRAM